MKRSVIIICDGLQPGGAERQTLLLAGELRRDWNPIVVSLGDGPLRDEYKNLGISTYILRRKYKYDLIYPIIEFKKLIHKFNPVIVHTAWGYMASIIATYALKGSTTPHISGVIRNGTVIPNKNNLLMKYASRQGNMCIANSYAGLKAWKIPAKKGKVIYNGFDFTRIPIHQTCHRRSSDHLRVIMTASMTFKKDWSAFVETARILSEGNLSGGIDFYGFGDGVCRERILKEAHDLITSNNIYLPGRIKDTISECRNSDIGILLSPYGEGMSNSIMEYMACGLPVICTNSGGNSELVIEGETGFLVSKKDPSREVVEKLLWFMEHPDSLREMGKAGKERIRNHFSTEKMVESYNSVYKELLK